MSGSVCLLVEQAKQQTLAVVSDPMEASAMGPDMNILALAPLLCLDRDADFEPRRHADLKAHARSLKLLPREREVIAGVAAGGTIASIRPNVGQERILCSVFLRESPNVSRYTL